MATWTEVAQEAAELVALVEGVFAARRMKTLATLRRDGSPRLSEISGAAVRHGELWLGLIPSLKVGDLDRDPRCSVHCGSPTDAWAASVRVSGRAVRAMQGDAERLGLARSDEEERLPLFRLDVSEVVVTRPDPESELILVEWWNSQRGTGTAKRKGG